MPCVLSRPHAVLTALVTMLFILVGPAAPATGAVTSTVTVWTWNVAGNAIHRGSTTDGMVVAAASSIIDRGADFVVVTEVCRQQYDALQHELVAADWPQVDTGFSRFTEHVGAGSSYCGGQPYGIGLFVRTAVLGVDRYTLPQDDRTELRRLVCLQTQDRPAARLCGTHITPSSAYAAPQLDRVRSIADGYRSQGLTPVVAGDFNAAPHYGRMNGWYAPSADSPANPHNVGDYRELDDDDPGDCDGYGEWTASGAPGGANPCSGSGTCDATAVAGCAKIDMIFVPEDRIAGAYSGDALPIPTTCPAVPATTGYAVGSCSDHRILVGTVPVVLG